MNHYLSIISIAIGGLFVILIANTHANSYLQSPSENAQRDIDQSVWKPFKNAFETQNGAALNALYADQVLRVTPEGIDTANAFKRANLQRFIQNTKDRDSIALDFWLDQRATNETTSYEVGFFRMVITSKNTVENTFYGQFHIVLQKIDGHWKIVQDWDTNAIGGKEITASDFARKTPLKF